MKSLCNSLGRMNLFKKCSYNMNFDCVVKGRRSVRDFLDKEVPDELIEEVIEAGTWAPSAHNCQPWTFHVVKDQDLLIDISSSISGDFDIYGSYFHGASAIFIGSTNYFQMDGIDCKKIEVGMMMQNMELAAFEKGLDTCTVGVCLLGNDLIREKLEFDEDEEFVCAIAIGYRDDTVTIDVPPRYPPKITFH